MIPTIIQNSRKRISEICEKYQIKELSLFGSQARGDFSNNSDFDFLVDFKSEARISFFDLGRIQNELEEIVKKKVDLVPKDGLKPIIRQKVLAEAEVVYAI